METFLREPPDKERFNKVLIATSLAAILLITGAIGAILLIPSSAVEEKDALEGAFFEGSPEFEEYNREVIVFTHPDRILEAMTGMGSITMYIGSTIRNKGDRALSGLQVRVGVIDQKNKPIKEKKYTIIPKLQQILGPSENVDVTVNIGGFSLDDDRANVRWKVTAIKFAE